MNPHSDQNEALAAELDRRLKALPNLQAPSVLSKRIMAAIAQREALPWYRRSWTTWPMLARHGSLVLLFALFTLLSLAVWWAPRSPWLNVWLEAGQDRINQFFAFGGAIATVISAARVVLGQLPFGVLLGCLAVIVLGWAACFALGMTLFRIVQASVNPHNAHANC